MCETLNRFHILRHGELYEVREVRKDGAHLRSCNFARHDVSEVVEGKLAGIQESRRALLRRWRFRSVSSAPSQIGPWDNQGTSDFLGATQWA